MVFSKQLAPLHEHIPSSTLFGTQFEADEGFMFHVFLGVMLFTIMVILAVTFYRTKVFFRKQREEVRGEDAAQ